MIDHIILTVSDVERSLKFYEAALQPLNIKFFFRSKVKTATPTSGGLAMVRKPFSG
jgi:catechol 2,3-dioxygenase-like lactoylglutathione lyase family enzyme